MKTLVIRTVIITIACIVAVAAIAYILTATVFPGAMADVYGNLGAYEKAAAYKTRAYESGGRIEDLAAASEYAVKSGDDKLIVSTVEKLIEDEAFAFYRAENGGRVGFLTARYVVAGYAVSGAEDALIDKAFSLLIGYGT
ncbi:MAG: hypothetical protein ILP02_03075, partial [Clostridia bacterium]|nr:hypothetical protein [Clostridia bacterium]